MIIIYITHLRPEECVTCVLINTGVEIDHNVDSRDENLGSDENNH